MNTARHAAAGPRSPIVLTEMFCQLRTARGGSAWCSSSTSNRMRHLRRRVTRPRRFRASSLTDPEYSAYVASAVPPGCGPAGPAEVGTVVGTVGRTRCGAVEGPPTRAKEDTLELHPDICGITALACSGAHRASAAVVYGRMPLRGSGVRAKRRGGPEEPS